MRTLEGWPRFGWLDGVLADRIVLPSASRVTIDGVAILGTDDAEPDAGAMLYFDVRDVSREYRWTISGNVWTWSRDEPGLSQRMVFTIADDGQSIEATGQMSRNSQPWEPDLQTTYSRVS